MPNILDEIKVEFKNHEHLFDIGGLDERYDVAKKFTEDYCTDTPYYAAVDEYCANCTVTRLRNRDTRTFITW